MLKTVIPYSGHASRVTSLISLRFFGSCARLLVELAPEKTYRPTGSVTRTLLSALIVAPPFTWFKLYSWPRISRNYRSICSRTPNRVLRQVFG